MAREGMRRAAASVAICACLALQGIATFGAVSHLLWPFMDYPMYSTPHAKGEPVTDYVVVGVLDDGTDVVIQPEDLGMYRWRFRKDLVGALRGVQSTGEPSWDQLEMYRQIYQRRQGRPLLGLRLESRSVVMTPEGVKALPPEVVKLVRFDLRRVEP